MEEIRKYFPHLTEEQEHQMAALDTLYREWNSKINVISRKDIDNLYCHHVLHSLAIQKFVTFQPGTRLLDIGTGGGFPGIPLAIMNPKCQFRLIDGTNKKITVVKAVAEAIGLKNIEALHERAEEEKGKYDFIISRAVMPMPDLVRLCRKNISPIQRNSILNGIICLKGGELAKELNPLGKKVETEPISNYFQEEWFEEKHIIYLPI
jgi:16S rRNA (guanine527-N7)-methyltransferase